jgi:hypothetical protein
MTTSITFDGVTLTNSGSMVNFPNGYPTVLNKPSVVFDSNARTGGIVITDNEGSASFTGSYSIFGGRSEYNTIKAKEGTVGQLVITIDAVPTTINNVALLSVSGAVTRGPVITCQLAFNLTTV